VKYIQKQREPEEFTQWKQKTHTWKQFTKKTRIRNLVKISLLNEQFYLCCYCEQSLDNEPSQVESLSDSDINEDDQPDDPSLKTEQAHIEHFQPKSNPNVDPLNYENLLCSCLKDWPPNIPLHCGALKDNWFDPVLLISPLDPTCESRFAYSAEGDIIPANPDDIAAATTIEKLGLNIPKLRAMRAAAADLFMDESLSLEEINRLVDDYLQEKNGRLNRFWTTIKYLYA